MDISLKPYMFCKGGGSGGGGGIKNKNKHKGP